MARIWLVLCLGFLCHFIGIAADALYVDNACYILSNSTSATLEERNQAFSWNLDYFVVQANDSVKFNVSTFGDSPYKVLMLFQCREDISKETCYECVFAATQRLLTACSVYDEAVMWFDECTMRYTYRTSFSSFESLRVSIDDGGDPDSIMPNATALLSGMNDTFSGLIKEAATTGTNGSHFAASELYYTSSNKVYGLAQCSRDLNGSQCQHCLEIALTNLSIPYYPSWALVFLSSCQLRYDEHPILEQDKIQARSPPPSPSTLDDHATVSPTSKRDTTSMKPGVIAAIASASSLGFVLLIFCSWLCICRTRPGESFDRMSESNEIADVLQDGTMEDISSLESLQFDFKVVKAATCDFSDENKLGQGGFGEVFKGKLSNGEDVAVKRLSHDSAQGNVEFRNEVLFLAKLQHRNLVRLLGFCISRNEKILIYEFLSNSSLDHFLYDPIKREILTWEIRFKIIIGVARGLLYLHEDSRLKIIHRDLKVSNILLDEAMNAKIADFGLAKLFKFDQTQADTMRIAGTFGYMAPEYALAGQFSVKSDAYSFGVIVLEIVSGQKTSFFHEQSDEGLIKRAWRLWNEDAIHELIDPLLANNCSEEEVKLCIQLGLLCIQEDAAHRPRMASVVAALSGQAITLPVPNAPHFYAIGTVTNATANDNYDSLYGSEDQYSKSDHSNATHTGTSNIGDVSPR